MSNDVVQISIPYEFKNTIVSPFEYEQQFSKGKIVDISAYNIDSSKQDLRGLYIIMDAKFDVHGVVITLSLIDSNAG